MNKRRKRRRLSIGKIAIIIAIPLAVAGGIILAFALFSSRQGGESPESLTRQYFTDISDGDYGSFYESLTAMSREKISLEDFVSKHENIYEGIEASNIDLMIGKVIKESERTIVNYSLSLDTLAGEISYDNEAVFYKDSESGDYQMDWSPSMIFPQLTWDDRVSVNTLEAKRGQIFDRHGVMLAGEGVASSVGFVPGKISAGNRDEDIAKVALLLDTSSDNINNKLGASWVTDEVFVPITSVPKDAMELKASLLEVPGIMIQDTMVRVYPLGEKASLLTGYVQSVTAEDLEKYPDRGYSSTGQIGKSGLELIYEDRLRPKDGHEIAIKDQDGKIKQSLAKIEAKDGDGLQLTIDADIQSKLYDLFSQDKSCSVALDPETGAVLALVSMPTYNANDFVLGMSANQWEALNDDPGRPLTNRFREAHVPGSTMKGITAAIGLDIGAVTPSDDFGPSGTSWQLDSSWGSYHVTTLAQYSGPANLENALTFSDNIFFAKLALKIGAKDFAAELNKIGFGEEIPFEYGLASSSISSSGEFSSDIQLADSGYGQGQVLVNPVHLAVIYASFVNQGNILRPQLIYSDSPREIWIEDAFAPETASIVKNDLIQVVERGTGTEAKIPGLSLAGKTGTAEIKQSQEDQEGTELGWFVLFNADEDIQNPLLVVSMVEDVKERGGSHYVVPKVKTLFE